MKSIQEVKQGIKELIVAEDGYIQIHNKDVDKIINNIVEEGLSKGIERLKVQDAVVDYFYEKLVEKDILIVCTKTVVSPETFLLVEDGAVDVDELKAQGFKTIVYRQGSMRPEWLKKPSTNV